jgi:hypothetical protein
MSRLMSGSRRSSVNLSSSIKSAVSSPEGISLLHSRPASASIVRLSRPSLFAAAARVTKEQERQGEGQTVGKTATRAKLQLVLRHTPQLRAVLKGLPHLHSGHSLSGGDALQQGEGGGSMAPIALEGWAQAMTHEIATFVMQLGILRLLLQRASEGDGWGTVTSQHEHKQQLECTARCLGHQAAFEFVREFLGRNEENRNGDAFDQAAQMQGTSVLTILQQMLLRSAAALKPTLGQPKEENGVRPNHLKAKEPFSPARSPPPDPREDMVKFRQLGPSLPFDVP